MEQNSSMDRISSLPKEVTESILECLSIRDALRTSILSRKWRNKWKSLQKLEFSCCTVNVNAINRILLLHSSKIRKFYLIMPNDPRDIPDIIPLIYHLSINGIKDLALIYGLGYGDKFTLPSYLFSCPELTHLKLFGFIFRPPPEFCGFSYLISLQFSDMKFKEVIFETFLSSSPLLEELILYRCTGVENLVIDAPNLKDLVINQCDDIKAVCLKNTQNVNTALIQFRKTLENSERSRTSSCMVNVFNGFPKIEKLTLGDYWDCFFKLSGAGGVPVRLPNSLDHLKLLQLNFSSFLNLNHVSYALCLIRSSPNLQELSILGIESIDDDMGSVMNYLEQALTCRAALDQLQKVTFSWIGGVSPELEIIKFLLACAPSLKTMNVRFKRDADADKMLSASMELLSFQRASSEAKVIIGKGG